MATRSNVNKSGILELNPAGYGAALRRATANKGPDEMPVAKVKDTKTTVTMRLENEIIEYFRQGGSGYQTRINQVLGIYVKAKKAEAQSGRKG